MPGRYYEQWTLGDTIRHQPHRTVTETDNLLIIDADPQSAAAPSRRDLCGGDRVRADRRQRDLHLRADGGAVGRRHDAGHARRQSRL